MPDRIAFRIALAIAAALASGAVGAAERYGFGQPATPEEIKGWDIDISPDGVGLPPGHGDVRQGEAIFAAKCAACHGAHGEGKPMTRLAAASARCATRSRSRPSAVIWPYATTLFDYVRRAMPLNAPQSLTPDEVYAVSAYVLFLNGIVPQDATLDADTLAKIKMPNRDGFVSAYPPPGVGAKP